VYGLIHELAKFAGVSIRGREGELSEIELEFERTSAEELIEKLRGDIREDRGRDREPQFDIDL